MFMRRLSTNIANEVDVYHNGLQSIGSMNAFTLWVMRTPCTSSVIFKTLPEDFACRASVTEVVLDARIKRSNQRSGWIRIAQLKVEMVMEKRPHCKWKQEVCRSDLEMNDEGKLPGAGRTFISKHKYIYLNKKVRAISLWRISFPLEHGKSRLDCLCYHSPIQNSP